MATYTYVDLNILEGARFADLYGVSVDLVAAREMAQTLKTEIESGGEFWKLAEVYSIAIAVKYSRSFVTGVRARLEEKDLLILNAEQLHAHSYLRAYRDKHVSHSVNAFEENIPRANYCVERIAEEGIIGISCSHGSVTSFSISVLNNVIELTTVFLKHVENLLAQERMRLLAIVRAMSLQDVLDGGRRTFVFGRGVPIDKARKKMT